MIVIATPCPLLIAIPVAIIGAVSLAARRGIIIKDPVVLEKSETCRTAISTRRGRSPTAPKIDGDDCGPRSHSRGSSSSLRPASNAIPSIPWRQPFVEAAEKQETGPA